MQDPRNQRLAEVIVRHSTRLEPGEAVLIEAFDMNDGLISALVREVIRARAIPLVQLRSNAVQRELLMNGTEAQFQVQSAVDLDLMKKVQAYVGIRGADNISELSDVPPERMALYTR